MSAGRAAWTLGLVLALGPLSGCLARRDPTAVRWLAHDCTVGEHGKLEAELRAAGKPAQRTLSAASKKGPPPAAINELAAEAGRQYDEVIAALDEGRTYGLEPDEIAEFRAISREEFIRDEVEDFEAAYKSLALSGLVIVSRPAGHPGASP